MLRTLELIVFVLLCIEYSKACSGYTVTLNYAKVCNADSVVKPVGTTASLDKDCNLILNGCLDISKPVKFAKILYSWNISPVNSKTNCIRYPNAADCKTYWFMLIRISENSCESENHKYYVDIPTLWNTIDLCILWYHDIMGTYVLSKPPLPELSGDIDFCEVFENPGPIPQVNEMVDLYGLPRSCPAESKKYCISPNKNKINISSFKKKLSMAVGTTTVKIDANHDTGKTCVEFSFNFNKPRRG